jgi:hypothetical protein
MFVTREITVIAVSMLLTSIRGCTGKGTFMKHTLLFFIASLLLIITGCQPGKEAQEKQAQDKQGSEYKDRKEIYELQERCGKLAAEKFKELHGNSGMWSDKDAHYISNQRNHYNKKLNKCFVLLTTQSIPRSKVELQKNGTSSEIDLWDINEEKQYGQFFRFSTMSSPFDCEVSGKRCKSEDEWNSLIKPYMEE